MFQGSTKPDTAEIAAVIESDIRIKLAGQRVTPALLKEIVVESAMTLEPRWVVEVERDPMDQNRIVATIQKGSNGRKRD